MITKNTSMYELQTLKKAIKFNTVEVLPTDDSQLDKELELLIEKANFSGQPIRHYIGFEISGKIHLGSGIMTALKVKALQDAGVVCSFWLADFHTWINNKLDGKLETIDKVSREYFEPMMLQCCLAVGCDISKIEILRATEIYDTKVNGKSFFAFDLQVAKNLTLNRVLKSISVTGKKEEDNVNFGILRYPPMQVADAFFMQTHIVHAGMDQRKCHVLMRETASKLDYNYQLKIAGKPIAPIAVHHALLLGLGKPEGEQGSRMRDEVMEDAKMSKSKPNTCIFPDDSEELIAQKIKKAYCPTPNLETQSLDQIEIEQKLNPILNWIENMVMPIQGNFTIISREGEVSNYTDFQLLWSDYCAGKIHPVDLKNSLVVVLTQILEIPRNWALKNREKLDLVESFGKK
jgi:tyrosyl-tRNA synthetase